MDSKPPSNQNLQKTEDDADVDKEVLDEAQENIILSLVKQLTKGMDLHRVTLPTFVLEPRSMLERITDFMRHPELMIPVPNNPNAVERFVHVVRYYLAGWHIRPKGVKKPYNPVLGEIFRAKWDLPDHSEGFYVAEQTSHHPPVSSFFFANPTNHICVEGEIRPKSKFLGNSAAVNLTGGSRISFPVVWPGEVYHITLPSIYARGILFGSLYMEVGDSVIVRCPKNDLIAEIEFLVKGFFSGGYNHVKGKIKKESTGQTLYTISGKWSDVLYIQAGGSGSKSWFGGGSSTEEAKKEVFFDANNIQVYPFMVAPESEQEEYESRRLWAGVTEGIKSKNMDLATDYKSKIEETQRANLRYRQAEGVEWHPRYFQEGNDFCTFRHLKSIDWANSKKADAQLKEIIWNDSPQLKHKHFYPRRESQIAHLPAQLQGQAKKDAAEREAQESAKVSATSSEK